LFAYRLTVDQFHALLERQDFGCGVCGEELGLDGGNDGALIDHCHATDRVRGLLCVRCNTGLGHFQDDPDRLMAGAKYLQGRLA
jgi:hypothetical protein